MTDLVNHPSHYNQNKVETIDIIREALTPEEFRGFLKGNIIKYLDRYSFKNGEEDLKKAQWYARKLCQSEGDKAEEYMPWFVELYNGNWELSVKHWKEYRYGLCEDI